MIIVTGCWVVLFYIPFYIELYLLHKVRCGQLVQSCDSMLYINCMYTDCTITCDTWDNNREYRSEDNINKLWAGHYASDTWHCVKYTG